MIDAEEVQASAMIAALERAVIERELRELHINPSPADVEAYLAMTPRQRRSANLLWAVLNTTGAADPVVPANPLIPF